MADLVPTAHLVAVVVEVTQLLVVMEVETMVARVVMDLRRIHPGYLQQT
jgi:hypothetical protein